MMSIGILQKLLKFEPLSPLTNDSEEWMKIDEQVGGPSLWQSLRQPEAFSHDGGKTYYLLSDGSCADHVNAWYTSIDSSTDAAS